MAHSGSTPGGGRVTRRDLLWAAVAVVLVNAVGAAPALLSGPNSAWFLALEKPALYPPGWTFGVAWTILFTLLGIALYLVARDGLRERPVQVALGLFALQFAFNVAWTPTFFAAQEILLGLWILLALDVLVAVTIAAFARVDLRAAWLLVPYLAWTLFATVLNYQFWMLN